MQVRILFSILFYFVIILFSVNNSSVLEIFYLVKDFVI